MNLLGIAEALRDMGHFVFFASPHKFGQQIISSGFRVDAELPGLPRRPMSEEYFRDFLNFQGLDEAYLSECVSAELAAIDRLQPDVLITDNQLTASISARVSQTPHAALARWTEHPDYTSPVFLRRFGSAQLPPTVTRPSFDAVLGRYHLPRIAQHPWELAYSTANLRLVPSSSQIELELAQRKGYVFIGQATRVMRHLSHTLPDPFPPGPGPRILCYLSDKQATLADVEPALLETVTNTPSRVLVVDPLRSTDSDRFNSPYIKVYNSMARLPVDLADVVLCSGTRGVTQEALIAGAGLTFVGFEDDDELDFTARRVSELGAGIKCSPDVRTITAGLSRSMQPDIRDASRHLGENLSNLGGPQAAAVSIVHLVEKGACE